MEKNGISSRFVLVMAMVMIIHSLSVSQVKGEFSYEQCVEICNKACKSSPVYDYCMQDCMPQCNNLGGASSLCCNFASDKGKMEGCVDSCSKSRNNVYTQTRN